MKKNFILTGILVVLLVVTYFAQEKRVEKDFVESLTKGRLLQEEITQLKLPHLDAVKKDGQWWQGEQLLSHNALKQIETKLAEIKEIKTVEGEWASFFSDPIKLEVNGVPWAIGDLSLDKRSFYVSKGEKISLAVVDGEAQSLATSEAELEQRRVSELKALLTRPYESFKEVQLFRYFPDLPLEKVTVNSEGLVPFELDLARDETLPPPIQGISVHQNLKDKFRSLLTQATIREELPYSDKLKMHKMGGVTFLNKEGKELTWELWLRSKNSADAVLIVPQHKRAFHMVGGTLRIFFVQLQDYWDKKVIPPEDFKAFDELKVELVQGEKSAVVTVKNKEPLEFSSTTHKVKPGSMQDLFQYVFNLNLQDQADRVSQLSKSERKQLLSEEHLRLSVMGQELLCWQKTQELIVVNLTQGFKAHFILQNENFRARFEDVIE